MPEPHSTTAGIVLGAGVGLTGTIMGAQLDALLLGMVAAIFMSFWLPAIDNRLRAASAVAMSSLLAGYGSPVAAAWLSSEQGGFSNGGALRLFLALVIGGVGPTLVPAVLSRLQATAKGGAANG